MERRDGGKGWSPSDVFSQWLAAPARRRQWCLWWRWWVRRAAGGARSQVNAGRDDSDGNLPSCQAVPACQRECTAGAVAPLPRSLSEHCVAEPAPCSASLRLALARRIDRALAQEASRTGAALPVSLATVGDHAA